MVLKVAIFQGVSISKFYMHLSSK